MPPSPPLFLRLPDRAPVLIPPRYFPGQTLGEAEARVLNAEVLRRVKFNLRRVDSKLLSDDDLLARAQAFRFSETPTSALTRLSVVQVRALGLGKALGLDSAEALELAKQQIQSEAIRARKAFEELYAREFGEIEGQGAGASQSASEASEPSLPLGP